ncbi:RHS repeat domain-containing protein [Streptomyces sp. ISL-36]|uniref:RHS repeat domain-containing protein n=1 Tax=Streptomyces sp. ISL-36 TaxID=2819182 RepID=UPI00203653BC|nr:RHS repeat-associated core domain-containing protein [Streptomyces sp. ISL-36]
MWSGGTFTVSGRLRRARLRSTRRAVAALLGAALFTGLLPAPALALPPDPATAEVGRESVQLESLQQDRPLEGKTLEKNLDRLKADVPADQAEAPAGTSVAPLADSGQVTFSTSVAAAMASDGDTVTPVEDLPVGLGQAEGQAAPTGTWGVSIDSHAGALALGVNGVLLEIDTPSGGSVPVDVQLDYSAFKNLYGADWASRLKFVQFPDCYLSTPELEECQAYTELATENDTNSETATATIDPAAASTEAPAADGVSAQLMGASTQADPAGDKAAVGVVDSGDGAGGTFKASPLAASGKWSTTGSSGAFTWSYPIAVPVAPAGPTPKVSLDYNSQTVDGRTAVTSPQASWIGEGWNYEPGHIERRYRTCQDDTKNMASGTPNNTGSGNKTSDLCWVSYNAVMSLNGSTTELVRVDADTYRPALDDGTRIELKTGGTNGDDNGEYWVVTTVDGTAYHFGLNKVGTGHADTNSVSTVPVFGNHPGEPCHATAFADSRCGAGKQQAWRWGLDRIVDVHGNVMVVNWVQESNYYAVRKKFKTPERYHRFAYASSIEYGLRLSDLTKPAAVIEFATQQRCLQSVEVCSATNFDKTDDPGAYRPWWDTPGNLNCKSTSDLCPPFPSFWTQRRLESITTKSERPGQTGLGKVDTYTLHQSFPAEWYDTSPGLWLNSITRRGFGPGDTTGTLQSSDGVSFAQYQVGPRDPLQGRLRDRQLPNLVAGDPRRPGFTRPRIGVVSTEEGGDIEVKYTGGCAAEPATDKERANGTCFPVRWSPDGDEKKPAKAWFNKYVVASVVETDKVTTHGVPVYTQYSYKEPAWSLSDDEFTKPSLRTYSDWRGYREVTTVKGKKNNIKAGDPQAQSTSTTRYFLGVGGAVKDSAGKYTLTADDARPFAGKTAETLTYDRTAGRVIKRVLNFPWLKETASRAREGEDGTALEPLKAYRTGTSRTDTVQSIGASWQSVRTTTEVDATYGLPTRSETAVVKPNGTGEAFSEQRCTTYSYVHNTGAWLIGLASQTSTTATPCAGHATADPATELISTTRSSYDGLAFGATPVKGLATATAVNDGTGKCCSLVTTSTYDDLGRLRSVTKPGEGTTETQFTPSAGGPVTATTSIRTVGGRQLATTTTFDPGRALPLTVTDPNGRITRRQYDALGRLTAGWLPSRSSGSQTPSVKIGYQPAVATSSATKPAAVTTETLQDDGTYRRQVALYDGLGREVQTQEDAYGPGRIVVDTYYNDHSLVEEVTGKYLANGAPTAALFERRSDSVVPNKTRTRYDGLERPVQVSTYFGSTFKYATYTTYGDNYTKVDKPGSTVPVTDTYTDALGRVSSVRTYTDAAGTAKRVTSYGYDARGNRNKVTDPAGNIWTYVHDARHQLISQTDPDSGTSSFEYDDAGRRIKSTNEATAKSIFTEYDVLGRTTFVREGNAATTPAQAATEATLVKEFTYDTVAGALGKPASSTQYQGTAAYISRVTGYDTEYHPTGKQFVIPDTATTKGLSGTYTYGYGYTPSGKQLSVTLPAVGGLAAERVVTRYDDEGFAESTSGQNWYTSDVSYSPFGEPLRAVSGAQPGRVWTTNFIDEHTGRLERSVTDRETTGPHRIADSRYSYDSSGLVSSHARELTDASGSSWDTQCFTYDRLGQLVNAWTSNIPVTGKGIGCKSASGTVWGPRTDGEPSGAGGADAADSAADTGGSPDTSLTSTLAAASPAAGTVASGSLSYWQSFTYDWLGNRAALVEHGTTDTTFTYTYGRTVTGNGTGPATVVQPHTLQRVVTTPTGQGSTYAYDSAGNTTDRVLPAAAQNLTWTQENRLTTITSGGVKTTYVYDPEGNRLLESSSAGATLYLGETEVSADATGKVIRASRLYSQAGAPNVVRTALNGAATGHKLSVLITDNLGTAHTAVELTGAQTVTRRESKPFGESRGAKPASWPDKRGYLGVGIDDAATGLTHLGAREYDQSTGRFVSVDPVMEMGDPLQINGYAYAGNSPVAQSDPTGLCPKEICDGYGQHDHASQQGSGGSTGQTTSTGTSDQPTKGRSGAEMAADKLRHDAAVQAMAAFLRALWAKNPEVRVQTEYHIPGAGPNKGDGWADIVMFWNEDIYIWEVKSAKTAEKDGPAQLDRYVNTLNKIEQKKVFGRTVHKGWELPQVATVDPIDPRLMVVAQSTRTRPKTNRAGAEYQGVVGWWTRNQSRQAPPGMEPVPVWAPVTIQAWQPTPEQTKTIGWGAVALTFVYFAGRIIADPIP